MSLKRFIVLVTILALVSPVLQVGDSEAKRKKRRYSPPPLKILDISTSPMPYAPGNEPLEITVDIGLPKNLSGVDLLEVSSLISFPSKRSIRFLYNRLPIEDFVTSGGKPKVSTTLLWDGKDQTNQFVSAGTYKYEIRAKLMSNKDGPARTKIVSLRARGELEVSQPETLDNSVRHLEHIPFTSDNTPAEDLGDENNESENARDDDSENGDLSLQEGALEGVVTEKETPTASATP